MMFKGLRSSSAKKKFLGAIVIIGFVAFFALVATRYIVAFQIDLILAGLVAIAIILALLLAMEQRKKKKKSKRKKR